MIAVADVRLGLARPITGKGWSDRAARLRGRGNCGDRNGRRCDFGNPPGGVGLLMAFGYHAGYTT